MEVCGTHTQSFFRFGLDRLLPATIRLIAGPGCPVCVSDAAYLDAALRYASDRGVVLATFGDMLRVPGSRSSLEEERARGAAVKVVYSPLECIQLAKRYPDKKIVFLAVGFETTAPAIALTVIQARKERLKNLFFFSALKLIPPALRHLVEDKEQSLSGLLLPGHVSTIIGTKAYGFVAKDYRIACCVAGFEPLDILEGVWSLLRQIRSKRPMVDNQYARAVRPAGNPRARRIVSSVMEVADASWRGLGRIAGSGLRLRRAFRDFDAAYALPLGPTQELSSGMRRRCRCAEVLTGRITPLQCSLFRRVCSPLAPQGPCMVSHEGACNVYYAYRR